MDSFFSILESFVQNSSSIALTIGKEQQNRISEKWVWYYGGDLIPKYAYTRTDTYENQSKNSADIHHSFGLTARPFIGIRFNIGPRLYLSTEFSCNFGYSRLNGFKKHSTPMPWHRI